jgi:O-antigen biosynthesis protein WbqP
MIKRIFDIFLAITTILFMSPIMLLIWIIIRLSSKGPAVYWSDRVGKCQAIFKMPKYRTMRLNTPAVATHLLENPNLYYTALGSFLRKSSLDELPQLWSILKGDMSFVGPRPALFNQYDLINLRAKVGVDKLLPGLTGLAQINGRDDAPIPEKVAFDLEYLSRQSFFFDLKILWITIYKVIKRDGVSH